MKQLGMVALAACLAAAPQIANADDFYAGKTVDIVVGFSPGGAFDNYARLLGRFIGKHIPGNPEIIVRNMPGAGSLTAVMHLDAIAATDGTVIVGFNPGLILGGLTDPENVPVDLRDFAWLGSLTQSTRLCYTWEGSGIQSWDDLVNRDEVLYGGTAPGSGGYIDAAILNNIFDINIRPILGFQGAADIDLAVMRGEVEVSCAQWSGLQPSFKGSDEFVPLLRLADFEAEGLKEGIPFLGDLIETDAQREIVDMVFASHIVGAPYIMSKQVPQERLEILRQAFDATITDPEFLAEAQRMNQDITAPLSGVTVEEIMDNLYASPSDMLDRLREALVIAD